VFDRSDAKLSRTLYEPMQDRIQFVINANGNCHVTITRSQTVNVIIIVIISIAITAIIIIIAIVITIIGNTTLLILNYRSSSLLMSPLIL